MLRSEKDSDMEVIEDKEGAPVPPEQTPSSPSESSFEENRLASVESTSEAQKVEPMEKTEPIVKEGTITSDGTASEAQSQLQTPSDASTEAQAPKEEPMTSEIPKVSETPKETPMETQESTPEPQQVMNLRVFTSYH